ncbi:MAG: TIGR01440 family protein [Clostridia bacterium]|nr:TIGR01440 family protein [Clostridia bacterium]
MARPEPGDLFVVGCSSSEVLGEKIGSHSSMEAAAAVLDGIWPVLQENGLFLAAQCCEHLNRALVVEREVQLRERLERVNAVPQPKAGGSFATQTYARMVHPVLVSSVQAVCGMDIGDTLIGMHLRRVAVPVRLSIRRIGQANLVCARTRLPFTGGSRAVYDEALL